MSDRDFWQDFFEQAIAPVHPSVCVPSALPEPSQYKAIKIIAVGKAAAAMALAVEQSWPKQQFSGLAVCPYGHQIECSRFEMLEAAHPVPDQNSALAAQKALSMAAEVKPGELLLVLLSGGASSLLCAPAGGMTLKQKQQLTGDLLRVGAPIEEINLVRSHYSEIKAGGLLAQIPDGAEVITLAISDVVGDDPAKIGSGPTIWSFTPSNMVRNILEKYNIPAPEISVPQRMEPTVPGNYETIVNADAMLATAADWLTRKGYEVVDLGPAEQGEARDVAMEHVRGVEAYLKDSPDNKTAFLSGGELTVTVSGSGKGGPNQEYLLAVMSKLAPGKFAGFAADTDGCDGIGGAAGAYFDPNIHARALGSYDCAASLDSNNSYLFFSKLGALFKVNPTLTNVNDLRVILYQPGKFGSLTDL